MSYYTEDFTEFGSRERQELIDILNAWQNYGLPDDFFPDGVKPAFNKNSGYVFLVNSEYQVCMLIGGKLELWHTLPYSGQEGFLEDLRKIDQETLNQEDIDYLEQFKSEV
jgi:hypothetical protein